MTTYAMNLLAEADKVRDYVLISESMFERLATSHGLTIEADATHKFITHRGLTMAAPLAVSA